MVARACTAALVAAFLGCGEPTPALDAAPDPQPRCGDGIVTGDELCDDGNASEIDDCATDCTPAAPFRNFDAPVEDLLARHAIPGGTVAVAHDGRLVLVRAYGLADAELNHRTSRESRFRVASLSKLVTAAGIMKLVDDGAIALDDRAFDLLAHLPSPTGDDGDPRIADITVRQLLHHSGGWDRASTLDPVFASRDIADSLGEPAPATADMMVRWMRQWPLQFDPGARQAYSNFGYVVLGRVIEAVTDEPYETWVQENVLSPSGARMHVGATRRERRATGEVRYHTPPDAPLAPNSVFPDVLGEVPWPYGGWYHRGLDAAGGWVAGAVDYLRLLVALDTGTLLTPAARETLLAPPPGNESADTWYAMGVQVTPRGNAADWSHTGAIPGTVAVFVRTHDGLTWVALFNLHTGAWGDLAADIEATMMQALDTVEVWPDYDLFDRYPSSP